MKGKTGAEKEGDGDKKEGGDGDRKDKKGVVEDDVYDELMTLVS